MTSPPSAVLYGVSGLLGIFWLLITVLVLAYNIQSITASESDGLYEAVTKVKFVFDLLYLFVVVAILFGAISLITSSKGDNDARQKKPIMMIVAIGVLLFIRQMWITVLDGHYNLGTVESDYRVEGEDLAFANSMFYYVCTVLVYAALVAAMSGLQMGSGSESGETGNHDGHIPSLAAPEPSLKRESVRDHSQDPIYNGPGMQCQSGDGEPEAEYKDDALVSDEQQQRQKDLLQQEADLIAARPSPEEKAETRKRLKEEWPPKLLGKRLVKDPSEDSGVSTATQDDARDSSNDRHVRHSLGLI
ncbi:MAG: hypothetical protein Q9208_007016 [Pyrenodesmia sp. 3 TL-2023]